MKLCVQAYQPKNYIDMAEELIFEYKDRNNIEEIFKKYPDKNIILTCINNINWDEIEQINKLINNKLIIKVYSVQSGLICKERNLKFFFGYAITSYDELNSVLSMGVEYVRLGAPLFFSMDHIKQYFPTAKIRLVPNVAYGDLYPRENGIVGTWIRPEDIMMYKDYASTIEFNNVDLQQERALVRIYIQERAWPGDLELIISDINYPGVNRMIDSEFTDRRLNCQQKCQMSGHCHICQRWLDLADPELIAEYRDAVVPKYEASTEDD